MQLGSEVEFIVWRVAEVAYGDLLCGVLKQALQEFRREPGLDDLTRIYPTSVGRDSFEALASVLGKEEIGRLQNNSCHLEVRYRLRWHIVRYLQQRLINDGYAPAAIIDDFFSTDLGL
ncbi:hypothetical protein HX810_03315 [Pseudomonas salomonii]|uniref:Uncharacterized protein n=1 Tax=Pseudomonas salomonii TaxID=191391 RepID=A0A7Y8G9E6_9PSED|nr:hypothetical protein [Pseudomonas salomonii]NWF06703.1 hypothetical protein [Pseudomonas salomonii]